MNHRLFFVAAIAAGVLAVAGCKKDTSNKEIELPEGHVHLGAQWAGDELWVESFDPKAGTCSISQYKDNKQVEASTITFKKCRVAGMGGPMMRPMMPDAHGRPGIMNRPGMPPRHGMKPHDAKPDAAAPVPSPDAAPAAPAAPAN